MIEKYITLNPGPNLIKEDVTVIGIQIKDRHSPELSLLDKVKVIKNSEIIVDSVPVFFLKGYLPFPVVFPVKRGSVLEYIEEFVGEDHQDYPLILLCENGIRAQNEGLLKGFRILPESGQEDGNSGYASIKPFPFEKWKIKNWAFVLENYANRIQLDGPTAKYSLGEFGNVEIYVDQKQNAFSVSLEAVFSKIDFYKPIDFIFKDLLYIKAEPTYVYRPDFRYPLYPHIAMFVERIKEYGEAK